MKNAVTAILEVAGKEYRAMSKKLLEKLDDSAFKEIIESSKEEAIESLRSAGKEIPKFFGDCAELNAIKKALDDGVSLEQLKGAKFTNIFETKTKIFKAPCECCQRVLDKLGIKVKCH